MLAIQDLATRQAMSHGSNTLGCLYFSSTDGLKPQVRSLEQYGSHCHARLVRLDGKLTGLRTLNPGRFGRLTAAAPGAMTAVCSVFLL